MYSYKDYLNDASLVKTGAVLGVAGFILGFIFGMSFFLVAVHLVDFVLVAIQITFNIALTNHIIFYSGIRKERDFETGPFFNKTTLSKCCFKTFQNIVS